MKRSAKVCWVSFVFSTIVIAAVAGLVVYFTAFKRVESDKSAVGPSAAGGDDNPANPSASPGATGPGGDGGTSAPPTIIATTTVATTTTGVEGAGSTQPVTSSATTLPTGNSLADHLSHSVPGFDYRAVDFDGDGFATIDLDGSRSHTHYSEKGPPIVIGKLISMTWFNNATREPLASGAKPSVRFPVGTTIVGLTVMDNFRDSNTDYAIVIVEKPVVNGVYCYYYPPSASGAITISDKLDEGVPPVFASKKDSLSFPTQSDFDVSQQGIKFQMRCEFVVTGGERAFTVNHHGPVRLLVSNTVVLESVASSEETTSGSITLPAGNHYLQLQYARASDSAAKLVLSASGENVQYDQSRVLPVITKIEPISSTLDGGGTAKILGVGLENSIKITFGSSTLNINKKISTEEEVFVTVPAASSEGLVSVSASNGVGTSNSQQFQYSSAGLQPIKFEESRLMNGAAPLEIPLLTGIKYGPDHRYYVTATNNRVHSFEATRHMQISNLCTSPSLGYVRDILGLAFNPADTEFKLYVSASVLEWKKFQKITTPDGWANGQILLVQKNIDGNCLNVSGPPIIEGLPVSNHDHGVNGLIFDQDGKLHIQVGGFTNAGVNDAGSRLGGLHENPLSGASLVADINKPGFNGKITYDTVDESLAVQTGGDVHVFSPGWRNSFGIGMHSNGFLYATDNGASRGFGDMSLTCTTQRSQAGKSLADTVTKVLEGRYAGHPNRNRGRTDPRQCVFKGADQTSDSHYLAPVATFESSTNGVIEYTANTFGGQLKGELLCSKYSTQDSEGKVFRLKLNSDGDLKTGPDELWPASGLSIQMSPYGHLLMPRVYKREIMVLSPVVKKGLLPSFTAVMPFRGPVAGGNEVIVTGENLGDGAVAVFGDKKCTDATPVSADGTSFKCKVPPGTAGATVSISLEFADSSLTIVAGSGVDYWYMKI